MARRGGWENANGSLWKCTVREFAKVGVKEGMLDAHKSRRWFMPPAMRGGAVRPLRENTRGCANFQIGDIFTVYRLVGRRAGVYYWR